jgi:hypothetical protein
MAHGGSLSINPSTGLAEASFLKKILPMVAGAAITGLSGGAINPLTASMIVGGFEGVRTGDLGQGLMAGLGAYGGAGLGQGLAAAGSTTSGLQSAGFSEIPSTETLTKSLTADTGVGSSMGINSFDAANVGQTPLDPTKVSNFADAYTKGAATPETIGGRFTQMGQGIGQLGTEGGRAAAYNAMPTGTLPALGSTALSAMTPEAPGIPGAPEEDERYKSSPYRYNLSSGFRGFTPAAPNPYYRPTGLGYAAGGDIMMAGGGSFDDEAMGDDVAMAGGGIAGYSGGGLKMKTMSLGEGIARDDDSDTSSLGTYDASKKRVQKQYAAGNLKSTDMPKTNIDKLGQIKTGIAAAAGGSIGGYSDGGRMLKGPGDGMSDSIPAVIGKRQPARLADGEFVVPADVVSHLGNGSTDAGAKKLYSMMDKVRRARTGKKKQAPAVKADKYMPA